MSIEIIQLEESKHGYLIQIIPVFYKAFSITSDNAKANAFGALTFLLESDSKTHVDIVGYGVVYDSGCAETTHTWTIKTQQRND